MQTGFLRQCFQRTRFAGNAVHFRDHDFLRIITVIAPVQFVIHVAATAPTVIRCAVAFRHHAHHFVKRTFERITDQHLRFVVINRYKIVISQRCDRGISLPLMRRIQQGQIVGRRHQASFIGFIAAPFSPRLIEFIQFNQSVHQIHRRVDGKIAVELQISILLFRGKNRIVSAERIPRQRFLNRLYLITRPNVSQHFFQRRPQVRHITRSIPRGFARRSRFDEFPTERIADQNHRIAVHPKHFGN